MDLETLARFKGFEAVFDNLYHPKMVSSRPIHIAHIITDLDGLEIMRVHIHERTNRITFSHDVISLIQEKSLEMGSGLLSF